MVPNPSVRKTAQKPRKSAKKQKAPVLTVPKVLDEGSSSVSLPSVPKLTPLKPSYLVYVVLQTVLTRLPRVLIRNTYESKIEAFAAFQREYEMWTTGDNETVLFPKAHTAQQLTSPYLHNRLEMSRKDKGNTNSDRGKIEYFIYHRADVNMDDHDMRKRRCTIICEETTFQRAS